MKSRGYSRFIGAAVSILLFGNASAQNQQFPDDPPFGQLQDSQPDPVLLPGDQYDPIALPGDQYDSAAVPGDPLFHFVYDGTTLRNRGSAAVTPELVVKQGSTAPRSEDSPFGPAAYFSGAATYAIPYELDLTRNPAVTITAWVRQDRDTNDTRAIFSRDSGVTLSIDGGRLAMRSGGRGVQFDQKLPKDEWVFVAGVTDTAAGWLRMHQNEAKYMLQSSKTSTKAQRLLTHPVNIDAAKQPYVFVGAAGFNNWSKAARAVAMQDIRVFTRALSDKEINAIRVSGAPDIESSDGSSSRIVGRGPDEVETPRIGVPSGAPDLEPVEGAGRTVGQLRDDIENPEIGRPAGAPELKYDPPDAAEEAARQREQTGKPRPMGDPVYSVVAGFNSEIQTTLDLETMFLHEIEWDQINAKPCEIFVKTDDPSKAGGEKRLDVGCPSDVDGIFFKSPRVVRLYPHVITEIRVCNSKNNTRLKGVQIGGATIKDDGSLLYGGASDAESYTNCGEFTSPMLCPNHWAATGLVVHSADLRSDKGFISGLQLICRRIRID